ncbi:MAG: VCBS repeat-containing protein [Planctomycetes bacterium]|nr:VCBS repeat-containing protein [Planctomycetota bacterium]
MLARAIAPFVLLLLPSLAAAQHLLSSHTLPTGVDVRTLRPAGDTDGDGETDFVALTWDTQLSQIVVSVVIVSGETGQPLHTLPQIGLQNEVDAIGIGDVNGDGRSDVLLVAYSLLRVFSGATGQLLTSLPGSDYRSAAAVGDFDGNGIGDLVVSTYSGAIGGCTLRVLRGNNLTALPGVPLQSIASGNVTVRAVGDLTGDGKSEVACCAESSGPMQVRNLVTGAVLWSVGPTESDSGRTVETLDLDGDGKREVFYFRPNLTGPGSQGLLTVHEPALGAVRFQRTSPNGSGIGSSIAGLGDLDQDGTQDFGLIRFTNGVSSLEALSGAGARRQWSLPNWPGANGLGEVAGIGDVDDDGAGDFAVTRYGSGSDGWSVISGRILAEAQPQGGGCGAGPFFPQLGATRPVLGQTMVIAGQFAPANTSGILVGSLQPSGPVWLGASSCFAWFDLGAGFALGAPSTPTWSTSLPLPAVPQLAGFEIALQAFWAPTAGPLGYDLSNGVWARLGYQ